MSSQELLVAGSIALDEIEGSFGWRVNELGGSALYFALAASLIRPVRIVAPVGSDAVHLVSKAVAQRPIDEDTVQMLDAPTYRWHARQVEGRNQDLGSKDSIYDIWKPAVPDGFSGWAFVGSMRPDRQAEMTRLLAGAKLLAADAMVSYVTALPDDASTVVSQVDWYFCNHEEFAAFGGGDPAEFRSRWELEGLVLKSGPGGVQAFSEGTATYVPALQGTPVVDTTGAGDALAGGMLARWLETGGTPDGLVDAMVWGVACASIAISGVGLAGLLAATPESLRVKVIEVETFLHRAS
jgi:sugar/nucleoside kinase (ribokinase family)